jgi:hypothetical protein
MIMKEKHNKSVAHLRLTRSKDKTTQFKMGRRRLWLPLLRMNIQHIILYQESIYQHTFQVNQPTTLYHHNEVTKDKKDHQFQASATYQTNHPRSQTLHSHPLSSF